MAKYIQFECWMSSDFVLEFPEGFDPDNQDDYQKLRKDFRQRVREALDEDEFHVDYEFYQTVEY